jgi:hypothetical protein
MWLCDNPLWVERHQDLSTEPDLDPFRMAGVDGLASGESAGTRLYGVQNAQNRGPGAPARLHMVVHARRARRRGHLIRFGGPGMQPARALFLGVPREHSNGRPSIHDRCRPQSSLGFDCLEDDIRPTQPIRSAGCQASRMRSGGLLLPPAQDHERAQRRDHLDQIRPRLSPPGQSVGFEDTESAGSTTESGLPRAQNGSSRLIRLGMAFGPLDRSRPSACLSGAQKQNMVA